MPRILTQARIEEFRNRLCEVAAKLYFEVGYNGFNMRDLAARLGVSAMTPYRYFGDKNGILAAVRAKGFGRLADRLEAADGIAETVQTYVQFAMQEAAYYRLIFELTQPPAPLAELSRQERRAREAMIEAVATARPGPDAELLGRCLWSSLHGAVCLVLAGKLSESELGDIVSRQLKLLLGIDQRIAVPPMQRLVRPEEMPVAPLPRPILSPMQMAAE